MVLPRLLIVTTFNRHDGGENLRHFISMHLKIVYPVILLLVLLSLSGCFSEFEENIYGVWISTEKIDLDNMYEPQYEYIIFQKNGSYKTNIFHHIFVTGKFTLFTEDEKYFFQLEYKGAASNDTIFQYKFIDDTYSVLKIKNSNNIVTVFERE